MGQSGFRMDGGGLAKGLLLYEARAHAAVGMYAKTAAQKMETYAKRNRVWKDRTGDARKLLKGREEDLGSKWRVHIEHGVDYGIWLELANEKRYAILQPTVIAASPEIIQGLGGLMNRLR